jgi:hypothetical protein
VIDKYYIEATTDEEIPSGDHTIIIQNLRNPRSIEPTDNFVFSTFDQDRFWIGNGTGGNVFMSSGGSFD